MNLATVLKRTARATLHSIPMLAPHRTLRHTIGKKKVQHLNRDLRALYDDNKDLLTPTEFERTHIERLRNDGYTVLESFFAKEATTIREQLNNIIEAEPEKLLHDQKSTFEHEYRKTIQDTIYNIPSVFDLVYNESILRITAGYKKEIPVYYGRAYRTLPSPEPMGSSYFHRDGYGDFTIFVFLEDVGPNNGNGTFIRGSHQYNFKSNIPFSWDERHLRDVFSNDDDWVTYGGKQGTVLIADTTGYHKGPCWETYGSTINQSRDVIHWVGVGMNAPAAIENGGIKLKLRKDTLKNASEIQKLFLSNVKVAPSQ